MSRPPLSAIHLDKQVKMKMRRAVVPVLVAVLTVLSAFPAFSATTGRPRASTLIVDDDGVQCPTATFTTIQAAVNAASPGDTIQVCPGTYNEIVSVNTSDLTLVGQTTLPANCDVFVAPDPTVDSIIQATTPIGNGIVNLGADNIHLQGFTIQNNAGSTFGGYGVNTSVQHSGYLVTNNVIQNNPAGVYFNTSGVTQSEVASNCIRLNNTGFPAQPASGNGVYSDQGIANAVIDNNAFFQHQNGAITLDRFQNTVQVNINHNVSHQDAGLLSIFHSTNSVVSDNTAVDSAFPSIFVADDNHGLQVLRNTIQTSTGGVEVGTFSVGSDHVTISDNTISDSTQNGIIVDPGSLSDSTISNNTVTNSANDGVLIQDTSGNSGNLVTTNVLQGSGHFDCEDLTTGSGTAGTANTWTANQATTSNPAALCASSSPALTITKTHPGNFKEGKHGTYMIIVGNSGPAPTDGTTITAHDTLPAGLTATAISGPGWTCTLATLTCTRSDVLPAGSSYPPIFLKVYVQCGAPAQGTDTATVTGGGDPTTHTATDPTTIKPSNSC
ncbi:right-handed parallel beta-helix repeat-containing protein [Streptomyces sp. NPDC047022]|uniref:right-handed parallel beta-helix repeat-containing protein n=1 Tax=Streptomyces sp. NPDC047022 TaxID=3155737 RepID=UPI0033C34D7F